MVWISKSGLGILIQAPKVPFFVPSKRRKWAVLAVLGRFGGSKNGTSGAQIKIPRPLLEIHPQNPQLDHLGTQIGPQKVIFGHFVNFAYVWLVFRV